MKEHFLDGTRTNVTNYFSCDLAPVLSIRPGDRVTVQARDILGHTERFEHSNDGVPRLRGDEEGLTVPGPIEIEGAEPGMMLAVRITELEPDDFGWTMSSWQHSEVERRLGVARAQTNWLTWEIDTAQGSARSSVGPAVRLNPFLGVIGLSPREPGKHSLVPPHPAGGNLDCKALGVGATLYLPVMVRGAMLYVGDGHGAQGDGEVAGTAIECAMRLTLDIELVTTRPLQTLHAETPAGLVTFGLSADLNIASELALDAMLTWIQALHDVDRSTALALASPAVDLHVTQIASPVWGVHAVLPPSSLR